MARLDFQEMGIRECGVLHSSRNGNMNALSARALMPALVAKYLFGEANQTLRPYVGLGVSYLGFTDYSYNAADTTCSLWQASPCPSRVPGLRCSRRALHTS